MSAAASWRNAAASRWVSVAYTAACRVVLPLACWKPAMRISTPAGAADVALVFAGVVPVDPVLDVPGVGRCWDRREVCGRVAVAGVAADPSAACAGGAVDLPGRTGPKRRRLHGWWGCGALASYLSRWAASFADCYREVTLRSCRPRCRRKTASHLVKPWCAILGLNQ